MQRVSFGFDAVALDTEPYMILLLPHSVYPLHRHLGFAGRTSR